MKFFVHLLLALGLATIVEAQTYSQEELTKSLIENEKKKIIAESIDFSEAESKAFWPVYRDFEKEWEEVFHRKVDLLNHYSDNHGHINDDQALDMVNELIDIQFAEAKIRKDYLKKYQKILSGKKLARYYQLENKMSAVINYDLAEIIPLVE